MAGKEKFPTSPRAGAEEPTNEIEDLKFDIESRISTARSAIDRGREKAPEHEPEFREIDGRLAGIAGEFGTLSTPSLESLTNIRNELTQLLEGLAGLVPSIDALDLKKPK